MKTNRSGVGGFLLILLALVLVGAIMNALVFENVMRCPKIHANDNEDNRKQAAQLAMHKTSVDALQINTICSVTNVLDKATNVQARGIGGNP